MQLSQLNVAVGSGYSVLMLRVVVGVDADAGTTTPGSSAQLSWQPFARRQRSECRSAEMEYIVQQFFVLSYFFRPMNALASLRISLCHTTHAASAHRALRRDFHKTVWGWSWLRVSKCEGDGTRTNRTVRVRD